MQVNQENNTDASKGVKIETSTLKMQLTFQCTGTELFRALTVVEVFN